MSQLGLILLIIPVLASLIIWACALYVGVKLVRASATRITGVAYLAFGSLQILFLVLAFSGFYKD